MGDTPLTRARTVGTGGLLAALTWWGVWALMPSPGPAPVAADASPVLLEGSVPETCEVQATVIQDVSLINPAEVSVVCRPRGGEDWARGEADIAAALALARDANLTVSISAQRHSQGGHISAPGALLLDMTEYRGVRLSDEDRAARRVHVLSGTTWAEVQEVANGRGLHPEAYRQAMATRGPDGRFAAPQSLAVAVQQSSNVFSVGGSLSVNCHGRDKDFGPIITTVQSFRIMLADGRVVRAARGDAEGSEGARLFGLAIGGFGLFGVILDVTLDLRDNVVVEKRVQRMDYRDYIPTLTRSVLPDPDVMLHYGRLNIDEQDEEGYLRDMYTADFKTTGQIDRMEGLATEKNPRLNGALMELGEWSDLAKRLRWKALLRHVDVPGKVERMTLNNAMRPQVAFLFERRGKRTINILQEYFVPLDGFVDFIDGLRAVALEDGINLQNVTLRFVAQDDRAMLSYAPRDTIAVVLYINVGLKDAALSRAERWTQRLVDLSLSVKGRYYLAYQRWPTRAQLERTYPRVDRFLSAKAHFDPEGRLSNQFFTYYFGVDAARAVGGE
jgi:decaprenylphospho-beta-D-ribofuranose 2-oxidase